MTYIRQEAQVLYQTLTHSCAFATLPYPAKPQRQLTILCPRHGVLVHPPKNVGSSKTYEAWTGVQKAGWTELLNHDRGFKFALIIPFSQEAEESECLWLVHFDLVFVGLAVNKSHASLLAQMCCGEASPRDCQLRCASSMPCF